MPGRMTVPEQQEAAFFDLDRTLVDGSSGIHFVRAAYRAGIVSRTRLGRDLLINLRFRLRGSTDAQAEVVRLRVGGLIAGVAVRDLQRLTHLDPPALLTVVQSFRPSDDMDEDSDPAAAWQLAIRLPPLLRSETTRYVDHKLSAAGRVEPAFTTSALARLHDLSGGVPRGIDRLGSLSLKAAALEGLDRVAAEVVDGVARECLTWPEFAA